MTPPNGARQAAWRSLAMSPLRVFVTHSDTMEAASSFEYLSRSAVQRFCPSWSTICTAKFGSRPTGKPSLEEAPEGGLSLRERPCANRDSPYVERNNNPDEANRQAETLVHEGIRDALTDGVISEERMALARLARLRRELRQCLADFLEKGRLYELLAEGEAQAARNVAEQLLGEQTANSAWGCASNF